MNHAIPLLGMLNGHEVLLCDGKPFLILSFQLDCDSCYDAGTIDFLMTNAKKLGCTAVSLLLYWRLIEPREGQYDYAILDAMLESAQKNGLKIVLVWFGSYKNSYMHYAPDWVIEDRDRFARARRADGEAVPFVACPGCEALRDMDARAVTGVFEHLRLQDKERSVVLFQVNNETGLTGGLDRCHCEACERKFREGDYEARYGRRAGEVFSAVSILTYQEYIAGCAKAVYPLPCYMNAWLAMPSPDSIAGHTYPSGGPVYRVLDIYAQHKRNIDFVSPDIYTPSYRDFMRICGQYRFPGNPLYVAEHALGSRSRAFKNVYYAFGEFAALGFDPWAIDCAYPDIMEKPLCDMAHGRLSDEAYDMLESFAPIRDAMIPVARAMGTSNLHYWVQEQSEDETTLDFGDVFVKVKYAQSDMGTSRGMAIRLDEDRFVVLGVKSLVSFLDSAGRPIHMKDSFRGRFEGEEFIAERRNSVHWQEYGAHVIWIKECGVSTVTLDKR